MAVLIECFRKSEISNLDDHIVIGTFAEDVFWLQVTVCNASFVQILDAFEDLLHDARRACLSERANVDDLVEEFAALDPKR